jgi:hypothetical protein
MYRCPVRFTERDLGEIIPEESSTDQFAKHLAKVLSSEIDNVDANRVAKDLEECEAPQLLDVVREGLEIMRNHTAASCRLIVQGGGLYLVDRFDCC